MSFRATLINFLLRRTLKKMLIQQGADIPVLRQRLGASERAALNPQIAHGTSTKEGLWDLLQTRLIRKNPYCSWDFFCSGCC